MSVHVGGRVIGDGHPVFVIAEAGVNHNGDEATALRLVDAAAEAKADAVKFQTFDPDLLVRRDAAKADYQRRTSGVGTQYDMLTALTLSEAVQQRIASYARDRGLVFLSTPFDDASVDVVVRLGVPAVKVSSGDLTALPLLERIGQAHLPVLLSTGMGDLDEVRDAIAALQGGGASGIVLLHCLSSYPAPFADTNLRAMSTLRETFGLPTGYSDHTVGLVIPVAAVALGACVIEKHFTLDRSSAGPDHAASLEPDELREMVREIRDVEAALGDGRKTMRDSERDAVANLRKTIVARTALPRGHLLSREDLTLKRPFDGLAPREMPRLVGRRLVRDVRVDETVRPSDVE